MSATKDASGSQSVSPVATSAAKSVTSLRAFRRPVSKAGGSSGVNSNFLLEATQTATSDNASATGLNQEMTNCDTGVIAPQQEVVDNGSPIKSAAEVSMPPKIAARRTTLPDPPVAAVKSPTKSVAPAKPFSETPVPVQVDKIPSPIIVFVCEYISTNLSKHLFPRIWSKMS